MSGSSLFTLGFVRPPDLATNVFAFLEAATGLALLGLLIAYLPTIYAAFSSARCRSRNSRCEPASRRRGVQVLVRAQQMERFHLLDDFWVRGSSGSPSWRRRTRRSACSASSGLRSVHRSWVTAVRRGARRRLAPARRRRPAVRSRRPGSASAPGSSPCAPSPTTSACRSTPTRRPTDPISISEGRVPRSVRRNWSRPGSRSGPTVSRRGATSPAGGSTTTGAARPGRARDGAVRALVVGPLVQLPPRPTPGWAAPDLPELEDPGLGCVRGLVEADEPLGAEREPERVVGGSARKKESCGIWLG